MWNSTKTVIGIIADYWSPRVGDVYNGPNGIEWNVTVPDVPGTQTITLVGEGYILDLSLTKQSIQTSMKRWLTTSTQLQKTQMVTIPPR